MVEELKLAIKIDDASIEQSLLKQFANAQKMADKVVLDFRNVNFDDKQIEAKFKEMQKKAGQNPIDLTISDNALDMLGQIDKRLTEIFSIGKGKSFIDSSSITADIGKIENKINELDKKYEEAQKKLSSIGSGNISGKDVNLVDNEEFKKLSQEVSELKNQFDDLKTHMQLLDDYTISTDRFFELQSQVETTTVKVSDLVEEFTKLSNAQKALSFIPQESNISSGMKDAIPSTEATASVEKTTQAIREENNALDETVSKAKQAASELTKTRDIVSQNWYREKGTVVGKDSKGNDITRDADEFSFVERLKNGQLQTVLATYDEETGKWAEQVINVRTAFEQVEKAIISADNKIASLEIAKERTLASHPGYDATADDNQIAIERKKRDELQATLNLYGSEKEYVFEIEAATKRIADNQKRLNNKKQSQTNLRQAVSDEKDAKANEQANKRDAKQAQIEAENIKLAEQKSIYNELIDSIDRYSTVSKRIESGKAFEGDYEEAARLQEKIEELQNNPILSQEQLDASQRKLEKIETTLEDIATAKEKSDSIKVDSENVKNIQAEWDKNIKAIQDYMDAMTKLNNLKAKDKGTGSEANQIALQTQNVEELKQAALDARKNLSSIQAENPDIIAWKQWVDMMKLFDQASKGSAESAAKLKDVLDNIKAPSLDKYENKLASYQTKKGAYNATIARFNNGGWTSDEYLDNVQAVKDAVKKYEDLLNNIRAKGGITSEEDIQNLKEYESEIKNTIATVTNMSAAEKGYNFVSGQKELDKIHKLLNENSKMSSEAKAKIKAYYTEIESGNPSMSLDRIHGEIMKIYNAEVEAGRAGRSFFDTLKNSGFHQLAAQMSGMFGFYDVINLIKQAASAVTELNTQITELAKVSEDSVSQIYADFDSYANIAKEMGSTISDTIAATTAWSKDGYNIPDSKELAEVSLLYKNVGDGINIDEANESLVSTLKGFKLEADQAEHIVDVFNEVSNREPISSSGIGEALQRSAASFNAANTSLEKSVALVTATNSVLQDPEKVGNMWKTVSARIRGAKTELEEAGEDTDGMVESTSKLQALIKGMTGFDIMESDGKTFKDIYDIIIGIGKKWQDLNDVDRASLLEKLAGKNQSNALAAALSQVDLLKKAYGEATNAEGSAREENSKYQQSVQYSIDQTKAKLEELANDTLNSKFLKGLINAGGKIIDILDIIIKNVGILKPLIAGLAIKNIVKNFD